jgi:hypothetical protein
VAEPYFLAKEQEAVARFKGLGGTGRASSDVRTIVPAAAEGRVDTLWVARGVQVWGRFDSTDDSVLVHEVAEPGDQELLDLAAVQTILHAGTAYPMDRMTPSDTVSIAAIFRY